MYKDLDNLIEDVKDSYEIEDLREVLIDLILYLKAKEQFSLDVELDQSYSDKILEDFEWVEVI